MSEQTVLNEKEIGGLAKSGISWTLLLTITKNIISMGSTAILARLLSPDDYGLIGMVATLTVLLNTFQDMGLSWVTLQRRELTKAQSDNLFWINCLIGAVLWPICIPAGFLLENFYGRTELRYLVPAIGVMFLIDGIGAQPKALISRSLKIKTLSKMEIVSHIFGVVTAIVFALNGGRYWSLVAQNIVQQLSRLCMILFISKYKPGPPQRNAGTWKLLSLGGAITGFGLLTYFSRNVDSMLIGRYWGATELGLYTRAYFLMTLPSQLVTASFGSVMIPTLSTFMSDKIRLEGIYKKTFQAIAVFAWPISLGITLTDFEIVRLVYGEKWLAVVPILFWLSLAGISQTLYHTTGWLFVAVGNGRQMLYWALMNSLVLVIGFFFSINLGAVGVARTYFFLSTFLLTVPALALTHKSAGIRLTESLKSLVPVFTSCVLMTGSVLVIDRLTQFPSEYWKLQLFTKVITGAIVYSISIFFILDKLPIARLQNIRDKLLGR